MTLSGEEARVTRVKNRLEVNDEVLETRLCGSNIRTMDAVTEEASFREAGERPDVTTVLPEGKRCEREPVTIGRAWSRRDLQIVSKKRLETQARTTGDLTAGTNVFN